MYVFILIRKLLNNHGSTQNTLLKTFTLKSNVSFVFLNAFDQHVIDSNPVHGVQNYKESCWLYFYLLYSFVHNNNIYYLTIMLYSLFFIKLLHYACSIELYYFKILLTDSRSNKYSSKIEDTRHIHTTYILLQIKYNNIYCTKKEVHSHTQL